MQTKLSYSNLIFYLICCAMMISLQVARLGQISPRAGKSVPIWQHCCCDCLGFQPFPRSNNTPSTPGSSVARLGQISQPNLATLAIWQPCCCDFWYIKKRGGKRGTLLQHPGAVLPDWARFPRPIWQPSLQRAAVRCGARQTLSAVERQFAKINL